MKTSHLKSEFSKAGSAKLESSLPSAQNSADCPSPHGAKTAGFTRIELVVVVAGLGLLGAMSLAATTGTKAASDAATCVANVSQLLRAWQMYSADNQGKLVPNGDEATRGRPQWCTGLLSYSRGNTDNTNVVGLVSYGVGVEGGTANKGGLLGVYLGHDPRVFKCPSDLSTCQEGTVTYPRVRSVSMNCWVGAFITWDSGGVVAHKITDFVNPSPATTWVFNDERPDSINGGFFMVEMAGIDLFGQPPALAGMALLSAPASYHFGGAAHSFADGHAEIHPWKTAPFNRQDVNAPTWTRVWDFAYYPNNVDREWLQLHSAQFSSSFVLVP